MATTFRNQKLFCLNCGGEFAISYPLGINELNKKIKAFDALHKSCPQTWSEPVADQGKSIQERALWWKENGHVGMSSNTMWHCFMGLTVNFPRHPSDPDDFSRCYKLLEAVPEWRLELDKLKPLSTAWSNLVGNWDKLTEMYEANVKNDWRTSKEIGMYEFMKTLVE